MEALRQVRQTRGWSQRKMAALSGLSFKGFQLLEAGRGGRVSSLAKVAKALGLPSKAPELLFSHVIQMEPRSAAAASLHILQDGFDSWKIHLFNFVDAFRAKPQRNLVLEPPLPWLDPKILALLGAAVEHLSSQDGLEGPPWCEALTPLPRPWFVAGLENLKAMSLVESPLAFRRRNVFVLGNFLDRA